jgi:hypothetical protein
MSGSPLNSLSIWSVIAPFDSSSLHFVRLRVWPLLSDADGVRASCVNRASLRHYSEFPILRTTFAIPHEQADIAVPITTAPDHYIRTELHGNEMHYILAEAEQSPLIGGFDATTRVVVRLAPDDTPQTPSLPLLPTGRCRCFPCVTRLGSSRWASVLSFLPRLQHLRHLELDGPVNSCIDGLLPSTLESLHIHYCYLPLTDRTFPPGLVELHLDTQPRWVSWDVLDEPR